jgi:hypothetical protein
MPGVVQLWPALILHPPPLPPIHPPSQWFYTINDAHLGTTCQGSAPEASSRQRQVYDALRKFAGNQTEWVRAAGAGVGLR